MVAPADTIDPRAGSAVALAVLRGAHTVEQITRSEDSDTWQIVGACRHTAYLSSSTRPDPIACRRALLCVAALATLDGQGLGFFARRRLEGHIERVARALLP